MPKSKDDGENDKGKTIGVRLDPPTVARIDACVEAMTTARKWTETTRSEVIRGLVLDALPRMESDLGIGAPVKPSKGAKGAKGAKVTRGAKGKAKPAKPARKPAKGAKRKAPPADVAPPDAPEVGA